MTESGTTSSANPGSEAFAVGAIVLTVLLLSLQDALVKYLSDTTGLWQIWVLRSLVAVLIVVGLSSALGADDEWRSLFKVWTLIRSALLVAMWLVYSASLPHLSLAVAAAAYYTSPIIVTLMSAPLAGESVGSRRWSAVGFGFLGMLLILQPGDEGFTLFAILPFVAAVLYALAAVLTKTKCGGEQPMTLSLALNFGFLMVGSVAAGGLAVRPAGSSLVNGDYGFLFTSWQEPSFREWALLAVLGSISALAGLGTAVAYQRGRLPVIATFDFSYLAFAAMWGLIIFGDRPNSMAIIGMVIIAGAGTFAMTGQDAASNDGNDSNNETQNPGPHHRS